MGSNSALYGGHSVGQGVIAAANSFRHMDEWRRSRNADGFTKQQLNSITVLTAALGLDGPLDFFGDINPSERLMHLLGKDNFDQFEGVVLR